MIYGKSTFQALWVYLLKFILMELVELSTKSLAEAMSEKLGLPKPVYFMHQLEHGGYRSQIEFQCTRECSRTSAHWTRHSSPICEDEETSINLAADRAIEYMESIEQKLLVDYNYYQLEQQKKAYAKVRQTVRKSRIN